LPTPTGLPALPATLQTPCYDDDALRIITNEEMFAMSTNLSGRVQDCGSDVTCIAQKLRASDAPLGLVVVVNNALTPPLIGLQLIDTDQSILVGQSLGSPEKGETISAAIRGRARKLLEQAGFTQAGRVVVEVSPPATKITLGEDAERPLPILGRGIPESGAEFNQ